MSPTFYAGDHLEVKLWTPYRAGYILEDNNNGTFQILYEGTDSTGVVKAADIEIHWSKARKDKSTSIIDNPCFKALTWQFLNATIAGFSNSDYHFHPERFKLVKWNVGDRVDCRYCHGKKLKKYYPGQIQKINEDSETCDILFDDGDVATDARYAAKRQRRVMLLR